MKVVINKQYGGFSLSEAGVRRYAEIKGLTLYPDYEREFSGISGPAWWTAPAGKRPDPLPEPWLSNSLEARQAYNDAYSAAMLYDRDITRDDPALVQVVEELGNAADGRCADLAVVEVPDGVDYEIEEYDGREWVAEKHRTWA